MVKLSEAQNNSGWSQSSLKRSLDDAWVGCWLSGSLHYTSFSGKPLERLPPRLWEPLRLRLQHIYRDATGEEFAVLDVADPRTTE